MRPPRMTPAFVVLGTVGILCVACGVGGDGAVDGWAISMDTLPSGAVRVVHAPPAGGVRPTWLVEEELRIGTLDGSGPDMFGRIDGLAVGTDGRVYVLDGQAQEVRAFGPDGRHERTLGGPGEGPGELRGANGIVAAPDDGLWVVDPQRSRVSVFDPEGALAASYRYDRHCWSETWEGVIDRTGRILEPCDSPIDGRMLLVYDREMKFLDSIPSRSPGPPPTEPPGFFNYTSPTRWGFESVPFYAFARTALDPAPAYWSTRDGDPSYRLVRRLPAGDTTLVIESARPAVRVTAAERDSAIAAIREILSEHGSDTSPDWSRIPDTRPAINRIFLSAAAELWVEVTTPDAGATTWDVFAADGRYAGTAVAPFHAVPRVRPVVRGDRLWVVVADELGAEYVVVGRLRAAP